MIVLGKKRLMKAGVMGGLVAAVPLILVCIILVVLLVGEKRELESAEKKLGSYKQGTVYMAKSDLKQGSVLKKSDFVLVEGVFHSDVKLPEISALAGKILKADLKKGEILGENILGQPSDNGENIRTYYIDYMNIPANYENVAEFDIRIRFPNGEDYLVAKKKNIKSRDEVGVYIDFSLEEALLMSSAWVDGTIYEGTKIYAAYYVDGFYESGSETYPANEYVCELGGWEPNLLDRIFDKEMCDKRIILEENLAEFMDITNNK